MVDVFKDLIVQGNARALDSFIDELKKGLAVGWAHDHESENRVNREISDPEYRRFAFQWQGPVPPAAVLFMMRADDIFKVTNIVPRNGGELDRQEYNALLDVFWSHNVSATAYRLKLNASLTPSHRAISHWLSDDAAQRLEIFSSMANKRTGSTHDMDRKRWFAFLIQVHKDKSVFASAILLRWLVEDENWPEEVAIGLAGEYELALGLLCAYGEK